MIGLSMTQWPDEALRRVTDDPVSEWGLCWGECLAAHRFGSLGDREAARRDSFDESLVTTRKDRHELHCWSISKYLYVNRHPLYGGLGRYARLLRRFGTYRTVYAIQRRALRILEARDPSLGEPTPQVGATVAR